MATIGTFKRDEAGFAGTIATMTLTAKLRFVRNESEGDRGPSHRIFAGKVEAGAAWSKVSREGKAYLSAKLDDPSFPSPIYATLIEDAEAPGSFSLIWSRKTAE